jgi:hypothetical protein
VSESGTAGKRRADAPRRVGLSGGSRKLRSVLASVIWLLAVVAALVLAVGALLVALRFNLDNAVVKVITDLADKIDFGVLKDFAVKKGAKPSVRQDAAIKSTLVNWGIAALIYLVVGKVLDRLIRPRS